MGNNYSIDFQIETGLQSYTDGLELFDKQLRFHDDYSTDLWWEYTPWLTLYSREFTDDL